MENKQTAVDWLMENLHTAKDPFKQAKKMEKEQMNAIFDKGYKCGIEDYIDIQKGYDGKSISFEQYYNEIYGTK